MFIGNFPIKPVKKGAQNRSAWPHSRVYGSRRCTPGRSDLATTPRGRERRRFVGHAWEILRSNVGWDRGIADCRLQIAVCRLTARVVESRAI